MGKEEPQAVEADDDGAAFMSEDAEGEREASAQGEDEDDGAKSDVEILTDDAASQW